MDKPHLLMKDDWQPKIVLFDLPSAVRQKEGCV